MTFRQKLSQRKKEQAFKEFSHQEASKDALNLSTINDLLERFNIGRGTLLRWRKEWKERGIKCHQE